MFAKNKHRNKAGVGRNNATSTKKQNNKYVLSKEYGVEEKKKKTHRYCLFAKYTK